MVIYQNLPTENTLSKEKIETHFLYGLEEGKDVHSYCCAPIIYGNVGQCNNTRKEISNIRTEKDEKRLPLFADIMFIYIEKNNQITKLRVL